MPKDLYTEEGNSWLWITSRRQGLRANGREEGQRNEEQCEIKIDKSIKLEEECTETVGIRSHPLSGDGHHTEPIKIREQFKSKRHFWRIVVLSYFPEEEPNYISRRVASEVLGATIREDSVSKGTFANRIETSGHVNLVWRMYRSNKLFKSIFLVSKELDPWFDVLLGRNTMSIEDIPYPNSSKKQAQTDQPTKSAKRRSYDYKKLRQSSARGPEQRGQKPTMPLPITRVGLQEKRN